MEPNPILISNRYIFEAVQPETLDEPVGKSTILYANRFAGVQEIDIKDKELLDILNSTIGTSGNNVLVQLKQKMKAYPGGPWYIDSNDGIVHIHNRKFTEKTAHVYTYMAEPGEVLSASFKIVEVYKQNTGGLAAYVNAVTKTVSALLNPTVNNPPERPHTVSREEQQLGRFVSVPDKTRVDNTIGRSQRDISETIRHRKAVEAAKQEQARAWSSKTPHQRYTIRNQYYNQAWQNAIDAGLEEKVRQAPEYRSLIVKWDYYRDMCDSYGSNSPQAKKAYKEYKDAGADRAYIGGINTQAYLDWHEFTGTVTSQYTIVSGGLSYDMDPNRTASVINYLNNWARKHQSSVYGNPQVTSYGNWVTVSKYKSARTLTDSNGNRRIESTMVVKERCSIRFKVLGNFSKPYKYSLSKLLGEYTRSGGVSRIGDPLAAMRNAAANIGRAKKEKQLQATIRVVGNPELESAQQFTIQNVGKKYSGVWYIKSVSHVFEPGQGYICDLTLSKQQGKSKVSGENSTVNTRNYTSGSGKKSTSKKGRPLANRIPSDNYTYQDAMNEQWTAEEALYVKHAVMSQPDEASARRALESQSYNIADKNLYNRKNKTNSSYVTIGNGTVLGNYQHKYSKVNRQKVKLPKQAINILREYRNNKGRK